MRVMWTTAAAKYAKRRSQISRPRRFLNFLTQISFGHLYVPHPSGVFFVGWEAGTAVQFLV